MVLLRLGAETKSIKYPNLFIINVVDSTGLEPVTPCV